MISRHLRPRFPMILSSRFDLPFWLLSITLMHVCLNPACADIVQLQNGGLFRGKIIPSTDSKQQVRMETSTGALIVVGNDQVRSVTKRSVILEEYETRRRRLDDTWESHWKMSEWCGEQGLTKQRETHLLRVTELSPDHEKAQIALKRVWDHGRWIDRDALMASKGLVKYKNRYVPPQERDILQKNAETLKLERVWNQKVTTWVAWLGDSNGQRVYQAVNQLKSIDDPNAAAAVIKFMSGDMRVTVRDLCIKILAKISGEKAVAGLIQMALFDEEVELRAAALNGIRVEYYPQARFVFANSLKSEFNAIVCRSAIALNQIGDKNVIQPLIDALVTFHEYQVPMDVSTNQAYSFTTDGNFASNTPTLPPQLLAAVRTGNVPQPGITFSGDSIPKKLVPVRVEHYNKEVLDALEKLTDKHFDYNKREWDRWWAAEKNMGGKIAK